jgi:hypothetical protein
MMLLHMLLLAPHHPDNAAGMPGTKMSFRHRLQDCG